MAEIWLFIFIGVCNFVMLFCGGMLQAGAVVFFAAVALAMALNKKKNNKKEK